MLKVIKMLASDVRESTKQAYELYNHTCSKVGFGRGYELAEVKNRTYWDILKGDYKRPKHRLVQGREYKVIAPLDPKLEQVKREQERYKQERKAEAIRQNKPKVVSVKPVLRQKRVATPSFKM